MDARHLVLLFEEKCNPFKYQVDGVCIWPIFRFSTWESLKIEKDGFTKRKHAVRPSRSSRLKAYVNVFKERARLSALTSERREYDAVILTSVNRLRDKIDEAYRNIYFDYFEPGISNALYIYTDMQGKRKPYGQPALFVSNKAVLPTLVSRSLVQPGSLDKVRSLYGDFKDFLQENNSAGLFDVPFSTWKRVFLIYMAKRGLFAKIFDATKPKMLLTECFYNKEWAIAAARQRAIPVVELQHGIVYDGHMAYTYDPASADRYKKNMPIPDKILAFGEYFSRMYTESGFWRPDQVENIGLARLEHYRKSFEYQAPRPGEKLRVLISSQWILANKLVDFIRSVVNDLPGEVTLSVKPHPLEEHTGLYEEIKQRVEVLGTDEEFYTSLATRHIHCSVFSTTLIESLGLGIPTMIIGLPGFENALPITEKGYCKIAHTPSEFVAILKDSVEKESYLSAWHENTCSNKPYFWEPEPSEKMHRFVAKTIGPARAAGRSAPS